MNAPSSDFKEQKRALIRAYANATDRQGFWNVATTVVPLAAVCGLAGWSLQVSYWLTAAATIAITILMIRVFSLMHDAGHGSLFGTQSLNRAWGFVFGVCSGMPQYVWSQHHHFHHQTNGNWDKYRGPLTTKSVAEFEKLSPFQQWFYGAVRSMALAPLAGFVYLIFNPRFNWMRGSLSLLLHLATGKPASTFQTRLWKNWREYRHQSGNNVVLLTLWVLGSRAIGPLEFFVIYLTSVSLAGGVGIALFTVQHNFEHAYASPEAEWDIDTGAIAGTSFLILPGWLNWVTANIGFHHVHHLSAAIPCYSLPQCHAEYQGLFTEVRRITMFQVPAHLKCILWDTETKRIISIRAYRQQKAAAAVGGPVASN